MRKKQTPLYAGLFVIATIACFDVSAMDKESSEESSIIWTYSDIVLVPLTLCVKLWNSLTDVHDCTKEKEAKKEEENEPTNFVEAQKKRITLHKSLVEARKIGCSCIKKLEQQKEKAFEIEKEFWEKAEKRKYHPRLETSG